MDFLQIQVDAAAPTIERPGQMEFAPFLDFSPTTRRDGWLASQEETACAQADGRDFSAIPLMFPSTDAREILTEKARGRRNFHRFPKAR
jgi:hypothetical protein